MLDIQEEKTSRLEYRHNNNNKKYNSNICRELQFNDGSGKGRQGLENIGKLKGYYITNGKAIEITCEKNSRTTQTVYKDLQGNEIKVNDGKTFIQICPLNANVKIEGNTKTTEK